MKKWLTATSNGFILPATIMLGLAVSIISATFVQYIINSSETLNLQSYNSVAQEAAYSGVSYALSCIAAASTSWPSLAPNTTCSGVVESGVSDALAQSPTGEWRSTFSVDAYNVNTDKKVTSTGKVILSSGAVVSITRNVTITTTLKQVPTTATSDKAITDLSTDSHSCAIANGQLYCWGVNNRGQLGNNNTANSSTPILVAASNSGDAFYGKMVTKVAVGTSNTCAVADGQLYCWGDNAYGQLGVGSVGNVAACGLATYCMTPQPVLKPDILPDFKVTSIGLSQSATGSKSACAVANGAVFCWGANNDQQASGNNTSPRPKPTPIYGYGSGDPSSAKIYGLKSTSTSVGTSMGCAISQGNMYCWGNGPDSWWAGKAVRSLATYGDYASSGTPLAQPWSARVVDQGYCSINDYPICFGTGVFTDSSGHGTNGSPDRPTPFLLSGISDYDSDEYTSTSDGLMCVIEAGFPVCRGASQYTGVNFPSRTPLAASFVPDSLTSSTRVGVGEKYACIISNGALACWGDATLGQLANGSFSNTTRRVTPDWSGQSTIGVYQGAAGSYFAFSAPGPISAGKNFRCTSANAVLFCWGANALGQLGTGSTADQGQPTMANVDNLPHFTLSDGTVSSFTPSERLTSGGDHSCMITVNGSGPSLYCWGANTYGELGTNDYTSKNTATAVVTNNIWNSYPERWASDARVTEVSAGPRNTCAVADSALYCWGDRTSGIVSSSSTTGSETAPVLVRAFKDMQVTSVAVGTNHACAIVNGDGYCWGNNTDCATGHTPCSGTISIYCTSTSTCNTRLAATKITSGTAATAYGNLSTGTFTQIAAGEGFTCAIINGTASCWGKNDKGQTGVGTSGTSITVPTALTGTAGTLQADAISTGANHACAVLQARIYCWGDNTNGKLGDGTETANSSPVLINGGAVGTRATVNITAGDDGTCSVSNGAVLCWGAGLYGQNGDNGWDNRKVPTVISGYRMTGACDQFNCNGPVY